MAISAAELDERVEKIADEVSDLKAAVAALTAQTASLAHQQATHTAGLANAVERFNAAAQLLAAASARLDDLKDRSEATAVRIESLAEAFADFRGQTQANFAISRWIGAFAATLTLGIVGAALSVALSVGKFQSEVDQLRHVVNRLEAADKAADKK